jgi:MFS family permease
MLKLRPDDTVTPVQLVRGEASLVRDSACASLAGALSGGVILAAFALELHASASQIGLLAAIPFIAQVAQLPAIVLIERVRQRRKIAVLAIGASRVLIIALALVPLAVSPDNGLAWLIALHSGISALIAVGQCAVNCWLHQLIPQERLGDFFSRRLFWGTVFACAGTLGAGLFIESLPPEGRLRAYAWLFAGAAVSGFIHTYYVSQAPEPRMLDAGPATSIVSRLSGPLRDRNFRRMLVFSGAWNIASNLAAPFVTVYLIRQLGYPLTTVTMLWVVSQVAYALTLYLWGRVADRLTNKAVLAVALPVYFACTLGLVFSDNIGDGTAQRGVLMLLHAVMGAASGGIGLASGNLGLKLATRDNATAYLAAIGLMTALAGGVAPLAGGAIAQAFEASQLTFLVRWESAGADTEATMLSFAHWEFLFAISAALGLYVMHALSRIQEGPEVSERVVIQQFGLEALNVLHQLSSIGGVLGSLFPFERLSERRRFGRKRT